MSYGDLTLQFLPEKRSWLYLNLSHHFYHHSKIYHQKTEEIERSVEHPSFETSLAYNRWVHLYLKSVGIPKDKCLVDWKVLTIVGNHYCSNSVSHGLCRRKDQGATKNSDLEKYDFISKSQNGIQIGTRTKTFVLIFQVTHLAIHSLPNY